MASQNSAADVGFATGADRQAEDLRRRTQGGSLQVPPSQSLRDGAEKSKEKVCLLRAGLLRMRRAECSGEDGGVEN